MGALTTTLLVRIGEVTNRTLVLPLLIFYPTSRCNSRCISCDWWKHSGEDDLTLREIAKVADGIGPAISRIVTWPSGVERPLIC